MAEGQPLQGATVDSAVRGPDIGATLAAWRMRGDDRYDPVRFCLIEVMARRAADHTGATRRVLDERLRALLEAYGEARDQASSVGPSRVQTAPTRPAPRGPLAELVDHIARASPLDPDESAPIPAGPEAHAGRELKSVDYFRSTWSRLSADRRLTQALAKVPGNAGPLNSHHLVHRALTAMREVSPEYLEHFMAYVDTLLWLDQAGGATAPAEVPRPEQPKGRKRG